MGQGCFKGTLMTRVLGESFLGSSAQSCCHSILLRDGYLLNPEGYGITIYRRRRGPGPGNKRPAQSSHFSQENILCYLCKLHLSKSMQILIILLLPIRSLDTADGHTDSSYQLTFSYRQFLRDRNVDVLNTN